MMQTLTTIGLRVLMGVALAGGMASLLALAIGLRGGELWPLWLASTLIITGTLALVGLFVLQLAARQRVPGRELKRLLLGGCPRWMRWLTMSLSLGGFGLALWLSYGAYHAGEDGPSLVVGGAAALFLFPAVFAQSYSYLAWLPALDRTCSNGHELPLDAAYCPSCGETVRG
ncbi:MAG: hypothetical protein ACLF0P_07975 [Thermoanaerobaculia bacterium]